MTTSIDRKSFIHCYTNEEIPMEFVVKFDRVLKELVESTFFEELEEEMDEDSIREDYNNEWDHEEHYTDAEVFAEKYSDF